MTPSIFARAVFVLIIFVAALGSIPVAAAGPDASIGAAAVDRAPADDGVAARAGSAPAFAGVPDDSADAFAGSVPTFDRAPVDSAAAPVNSPSPFLRAPHDSVAASNRSAVPFRSSRGDSSTAPAVSASAMSAAQLRAALLTVDTTPRDTVGHASSRNVLLAFGMSAVAPGAGQIYNRQWVKAAVAIGLEAALVAGYFVFRSRGQDEEAAYKAYAHEFWDPARYATWLNDYVDYLELEHGADIDADPVAIPVGIDFTSPESWSADDRQMARAFFNQIRGVEDDVYHPETGASFSHKLPYFGEQQYYELIGKYFQFAPGWVDYPAWMEAGEFTLAIDPEYTGPGGSKPNIRGRFLEYAADHADANTLLRRASRISAIIVLNHLVSAIDAAITSKLHNDSLTAGVALRYDVQNEPQLLGSLRWRF